jgi:hypothetical protein
MHKLLLVKLVDDFPFEARWAGLVMHHIVSPEGRLGDAGVIHIKRGECLSFFLDPTILHYSTDIPGYQTFCSCCQSPGVAPVAKTLDTCKRCLWVVAGLGSPFIPLGQVPEQGQGCQVGHRQLVL